MMRRGSVVARPVANYRQLRRFDMMRWGSVVARPVANYRQLRWAEPGAQNPVGADPRLVRVLSRLALTSELCKRAHEHCHAAAVNLNFFSIQHCRNGRALGVIGDDSFGPEDQALGFPFVINFFLGWFFQYGYFKQHVFSFRFGCLF
jgi:hypothetical protein